jgi:hypothetical protein
VTQLYWSRRRSDRSSKERFLPNDTLAHLVTERDREACEHIITHLPPASGMAPFAVEWDDSTCEAIVTIIDWTELFDTSIRIPR